MTQDIVVRKSTDLAQVEELESILLGQKDVPEVVEDPELIQREIMAQLLAAESDEELETIASGGAIGWRELIGVPVELHGFSWRPSSYEEGAPVFFVVQGTRLDTGENVVLTTGSGSVLAQLTNMARRGTLKGAVRMIDKATDKPTQGGFWPLALRTPVQAQVDAAKDKVTAA